MNGVGLLVKLKTDLKSVFFQNLMMLMSGGVLAQIITVAFAPVLSRLYDPQLFGLLGVYVSATCIIGMAATLRYDVALILPKSENDAANLLGLSLLCAAGVSLVAGAICVPFKNQIVSLTNSPELSSWMWVLPISIFLYGVFQTCNAWSTRRKQFQRLSVCQVVRSATISGAQTAAGFSRMGTLGLVGGSILGEVCATFVLAAQVIRDDFRMIYQSLAAGRIKTLAKEYGDFPLYSTPEGLCGVLSYNLPLLLLPHYFGLEAAGLYFMCVRILQMPMNLILISLRQVLLQKTSEVFHTQGDTYAVFKKVTLGLMAMSIPPVLIIVFLGPSLFSFVLGEKWYVAGQYASWIIIWMAMWFSDSPAVIFTQVYRKQRFLFLWNVVLLFCRAGVLVIGGLYLNALQTIAIFSITGLIFELIPIVYIWRLLRRQSVPQPVES